MQPQHQTQRKGLHLGPWGIYFSAKLALYAEQAIGFHALENLALALFVALPLRAPWLRRMRQAVALPLGLALLYYDSWLPPVSRLLDRAAHLGDFSPAFVLEFVARFAEPGSLLVFVLLWGAYRLLRRVARLDTMVMATLAALSIHASLPALSRPFLALGVQPTQAEEPPAPGTPAWSMLLDTRLRAFHTEEARRHVTLHAPAPDAVPFDVLFLHVCSLSWDDLDYAGLRNHPLFGHFQILFRDFNSAASYSTPAAVRLLRANCGQPPHAALGEPAPEGCYLFPSLARLGFETQKVLNHDGRFDDFASRLTENGLPEAPLNLSGLGAALHAFDGSPVYDDLQVLSRWWGRRLATEAPRVAAYYNTITLHDGNHPVRATGNMLGSRRSYPRRLRRLLDDLETFLRTLEAGARPMMVILIPEHGAAMRGDRLQIPGLREIPTPRVTRVPAAVAFIGARSVAGGPVLIDRPSSYLALSALLDRALDSNVFGTGIFDPAALTADLPATPFVAENAGSVVIRQAGAYAVRLADEPWMPYPETPPLVERIPAALRLTVFERRGPSLRDVSSPPARR
ncbi:MAG TPA: cellulose biosynthesis protein BcsG [Chromatiales bacterium]|nr:cellulose biosynthesis protein BcsG [Chromatiales bacterium]